MRLTLVDHNVLTGQDCVLEDCVVSVIDHHVNERPESERYAKILAKIVIDFLTINLNIYFGCSKEPSH